MACECVDWLARSEAGLPPRCEKHQTMMQTIHEAYHAADDRLSRRIYEESDGFGPVDPDEVEWDWSGIRDSSPEAIEAMFAVVQEARA